MPRRIIYLRNPSAGSHFRTLGGSSGAPRTGTSRTRSSKPSLPPNTYQTSTGARYKTTPGNWAINNADPSYIHYADLDYGDGIHPTNLGPFGAGAYQQQWTADFEPASTLLGQLYDIAQGYDPDTGAGLPNMNTPGVLKFGVGTVWMNIQAEIMDKGAQGYSLNGNPINPLVVGGEMGLIPPAFPNAPANYSRPAWLQTYEQLQGQKYRKFLH